MKSSVRVNNVKSPGKSVVGRASSPAARTNLVRLRNEMKVPSLNGARRCAHGMGSKTQVSMEAKVYTVGERLFQGKKYSTMKIKLGPKLVFFGMRKETTWNYKHLKAVDHIKRP